MTRVSKNLGQILPGTVFGDMLTKLARNSECIVEIGTWHGLGSTLCMQRGLERPGQRIWTVESDADCWKESSQRWKDEPRIELILGRALDIIDQLPNRIDLLLLDGDDLTSFDEFLALSPRSKYVAMDDTNELKNRRSRQEAIDLGWVIVADVPTERNGWAVFEKRE